MKNSIFILFLLFNIQTHAQSVVPDKYWLDDSNYEEVINGKDAFGDDEVEVKVVEYWAKFNEKNCFADWNKLEDVQYYRVDIAKAPIAKKKYRVRMAPTLFIIVDGEILFKFKAGLDLLFPATLEEVREAIAEAKLSNQF